LLAAVLDFLVSKAENRVADPDLVTVRKDAFLHAFAIDERAVIAARIANPESFLCRLDQAVLAGRRRIADAQLAGRLAPDGHLVGEKLRRGYLHRWHAPNRGYRPSLPPAACSAMEGAPGIDS
jgi:hypothetical protein